MEEVQYCFIFVVIKHIFHRCHVFQMFLLAFQKDVFYCKYGVAFLTHGCSNPFQAMFMCQSGVTYFKAGHLR